MPTMNVEFRTRDALQAICESANFSAVLGYLASNALSKGQECSEQNDEYNDPQAVAALYFKLAEKLNELAKECLDNVL